VTHDLSLLRAIDGRAKAYNMLKVVSAIIMFTAHGSNDVANVVRPWAAVYERTQFSTASIVINQWDRIHEDHRLTSPAARYFRPYRRECA